MRNFALCCHEVIGRIMEWRHVVRTITQIQRKLAREVLGGTMADLVSRLLVIYDAFRDLECLIDKGWRVEYDDSAVGLYLVRRKDKLRTHSVYADSPEDIVFALLNELDELEYHAGTLEDNNDSPIKVYAPIGNR